MPDVAAPLLDPDPPTMTDEFGWAITIYEYRLGDWHISCPWTGCSTESVTALSTADGHVLEDALAALR